MHSSSQLQGSPWRLQQSTQKWDQAGMGGANTAHTQAKHRRPSSTSNVPWFPLPQTGPTAHCLRVTLGSKEVLRLRAGRSISSHCSSSSLCSPSNSYGQMPALQELTRPRCPPHGNHCGVRCYYTHFIDEKVKSWQSCDVLTREPNPYHRASSMALRQDYLIPGTENLGSFSSDLQICRPQTYSKF